MAVSNWNFADIWEVCAQTWPDAPAQRHGSRTTSWAEFDRRANGVAATLLAHGLVEQDKVAQHLYNGPAYLESVYASCKAGLVPMNTNYRYVDEELVYLWDDADAVAVVFSGELADRIDRIRHLVPKVRVWLHVAADSSPCPDWAVPYEEAANATIVAGAGRGGGGGGEVGPAVTGPWGRSGDHLVLMYTGGTTGMPKGVMWRQDDLAHAVLPTLLPHFADDDADLDTVRAALDTPGLGLLPACPLMHATGQFTTFIALCGAGSVTTLEHHALDVIELLDTVERNRVEALTIVGDAFAKPILRELDAHPGRWDLSSLFLVISSGVMWSEPVKRALLDHVPTMMLHDAFSSSEAIGMGKSVSTAGDQAGTAKFVLGPRSRVIGDDGTDVEPGSGQRGRVAIGGYTPIGYYKDPEKSAATFVTIDGQTYAMPGDYATVDADGTLKLLGRGSVCINTGGEKVFPEEVEEVLKAHPTVRDAVVVGVADDRFGEAVTAVVELDADAVLDEAALVAEVQEHLADFKAPRRVITIDTIGRAPNGKVDYQRLKAYATDQLS